MNGNTVVLPNIDEKIWNLEYKAIEIIQQLQTHGTVEIQMDSEGSDCNTLGLYRLLDTICDSFDIDPSRITIHTCNQLEQHAYYKIIKHPPLYILSGQAFARKHSFSEKNWNDLRHFGMFIGRSSWQRLLLASNLWKKYKDISKITYHYDSNIDYHRLHLSFDELCYQIGSNAAVDFAGDFIKQLPVKDDEVDSYPILTPAHFSISKLYPNIFVEIVCETFLSGNSFYPTEKTWRPIICRTPFLTVGPKNFLANLRCLGFRTFGNWWDESYDQDADLDSGKVSIESIQKIIRDLSCKSVAELEGMHIDMQSTLDHNYLTFMNLKNQDFKKIWP